MANGSVNLRLISSFLLAGLLSVWADGQTPWSPNDLMAPQELASQLSTPDQADTTVLFVGFPVLYRAAHIPNSVMAGPDSKPDGLLGLEKAVAHLPRDRHLVIYCGCCPFDKCPNVRPAFTALQKMGFHHISVLDLGTNFHNDWVSKNYPVTRQK